MSVIGAELRKAVTLPAIWLGIAGMVAGTLVLTVLNAMTVKKAAAGTSSSPFEAAYAIAPLGTVTAVIIGVLVVSSEYVAGTAEAGSGKQILATLCAIPGRAKLLIAKVATVSVVVLLASAVTLPANVAVARMVIGNGHETVTVMQALNRCLGAVIYWVLTALMAAAITVVARNGVIPLLVLIVNSGLVSVSYLLTKVTGLAHWLPDMAGRRLFGDLSEGGLDAARGGIVMAAWTLGFLLVAGYVLAKRDV